MRFFTTCKLVRSFSRLECQICTLIRRSPNPTCCPCPVKVTSSRQKYQWKKKACYGKLIAVLGESNPLYTGPTCSAQIESGCSNLHQCPLYTLQLDSFFFLKKIGCDVHSVDTNLRCTHSQVNGCLANPNHWYPLSMATMLHRSYAATAKIPMKSVKLYVKKNSTLIKLWRSLENWTLWIRPH